jgi:hypothetical protein
MAVIIFNALAKKNIDYAVIYQKMATFFLMRMVLNADLQDRADGTVRFTKTGN